MVQKRKMADAASNKRLVRPLSSKRARREEQEAERLMLQEKVNLSRRQLDLLAAEGSLMAGPSSSGPSSSGPSSSSPSSPISQCRAKDHQDRHCNLRSQGEQPPTLPSSPISQYRAKDHQDRHCNLRSQGEQPPALPSSPTPQMANLPQIPEFHQNKKVQDRKRRHTSAPAPSLLPISPSIPEHVDGALRLQQRLPCSETISPSTPSHSILPDFKAVRKDQGSTTTVQIESPNTEIDDKSTAQIKSPNTEIDDKSTAPSSFHHLVIITQGFLAACSSLLQFMWQNPPSWSHLRALTVLMMAICIFKVWIFIFRPNLTGRLLHQLVAPLWNHYDWLSPTTSTTSIDSIFSWISYPLSQTSTMLNSTRNWTPASLPTWVLTGLCSTVSFYPWQLCQQQHPPTHDPYLIVPPYQNISKALVEFGDAAISNIRLRPMVTHLAYSRSMIESVYSLASYTQLFPTNELSIAAEEYSSLCGITMRELASFIAQNTATTMLLGTATRFALVQLIELEARQARRSWVKVVAEEVWMITGGLLLGSKSYEERILDVYDFWILHVQNQITDFTQSSVSLILKFEDLVKLLNSIKTSLSIDSHKTDVSEAHLGRWYSPLNWGSNSRAQYDRIKLHKRLILKGTEYVHGGLNHLNSAHAQYLHLTSLLEDASTYTSRLHSHHLTIRGLLGLGDSKKDSFNKKSVNEDPGNRSENLKLISASAKHAIESMNMAYEKLSEKFTKMEKLRDKAYAIEEEARQKLFVRRKRRQDMLNEAMHKGPREWKEPEDVVVDWTGGGGDGDTADALDNGVKQKQGSL